VVGVIVVTAVSILVLLAASAPRAQLAPPAGGWVDAQGHSPFVRVVNRVKDAVVNISAEKVVDARQYHSFDPFFEDWFGPNEPRSRQKSLGSGFIFRADGSILTNYHVVHGADNITVRLSDKMELPGEIVGADAATDLAILRIKADHDLPSIPLGDSDSLMVGDWVIAIGNPFPSQGLDRTVTVGVVSALGRKDLYFGDETPTYQNYIQTDASINPGNSGGPLVNLGGEVVGINAAIASPTGSNVGIGFAIPVNFAKMVIPDLMAKGTVARGWLGIQPRDLTWDDVEAEGLKSAEGVVIDRVIPGMPAEKAGLRVGDVITTVDGKRIEDAQSFMQIIWQSRVGSVVRLGIQRRGTPREITVTLEDRSKYQALAGSEDAVPATTAPPWLGLGVATATQDLADEYGTEFHPGIIVTEVDRTGPAYDKGIRTGMIISEIDHTEIRNREDYQEVVKRLGEMTRPVSLLVYDRRGNTGYIAVRPERRK
jgi:Do/DeqQ family serine protease